MFKRKNRTSQKSTLTSRSILLIGTFLLLFSAVFSLFYFNSYFEFLQIKRINNFGGDFIVYFGISLLATNIIFLLYIFILYLRYRVYPSVTDEDLPFCTVVVPAYNEGSLVYKTLFSLVDSQYPAEKLQIISIDDGSKDDTWRWMQKAKAELGDRISILQQPENMGKRHALYRGFRQATGEVLITVDSDSVVKANTLRNMAAPFALNEKCGAIAGNVRVLNKEKGLIPRMLNVSFAFSFEFIRSAQSTLGSVLCTPGALSAYRRLAVMPCLEEWLHQTFMGQPSTIGEDRAMTNLILRQGYKVFFQRNAYVYTNIPVEYKNLHKMFTRWGRSNVRETYVMCKFAFTNFRKGPKTGTRILLLSQCSRLLLSIPMTILMLATAVMYPLLFIHSALIGVLLFSTIQAVFYARKHNFSDSLWAYPYSIFYAFTLFWITSYAILTAKKSGWLTRELPQLG